MLRKIKPIIKITYRYASALYVTGDKAHENFTVLKPYLDFHRLENKELLQKNIKYRSLSINLEELIDHWELYKLIQEKKTILEKRRKEIVHEIKQSNIENLLRKLKTEAIMIREDLKLLKENSYSINNIFVTKFLQLPNILHENTPIENETILHSYLENNHNDAAITTSNNIFDFIEYHNPGNYYLKNEAAKFDLFVPYKCLDFFKVNAGFIQFSNPDFIKTVIAEGAGYQSSDLYEIYVDEDIVDTKINRLHLIGSGSMLSYLGFITKLIVNQNVLPLKFITTGKQYNCVDCNRASNSLNNNRQETAVQIFIADVNENRIEQQFHDTLEKIIEFYKQFEENFRIIYVPARQLRTAESLRASIQMNINGEFIEIGNLSHFDDFISKRLLFISKDGKEIYFPKIISGTIVNITKLILLMLETRKTIKMPKYIM